MGQKTLVSTKSCKGLSMSYLQDHIWKQVKKIEKNTIQSLSVKLRINSYYEGFTELAACSPDFIEDLLESLKIEAGSEDLEQVKL